MSAGSNANRDKWGRCYTPDRVALACVAELQIRDLDCLDIGFGGGAFGRAIRAHGGHPLGVDIDPQAPGALEYDCAIIGDYSGAVCRALKFDIVLGNPDFAIAADIIEWAMEQCGSAALILPCSFFGAKKNNALAKQFGMRRLVISPRPTFREDGQSDSATYEFTTWSSDPDSALHQWRRWDLITPPDDRPWGAPLFCQPT